MALTPTSIYRIERMLGQNRIGEIKQYIAQKFFWDVCTNGAFDLVIMDLLNGEKYIYHDGAFLGKKESEK